MKIINEIKQVFCKHEDIAWCQVKTMSYPEVYRGVCKKCGKKCNKIGKEGEIVWEK